MATITIQIDNHEQKFTVGEMRRRLAQVLSKLNGDQIVTFSFNARLENYTPRTVSTPRDMTKLYWPFVNSDGTCTGRTIAKIPDAPDTRHATMPAVLGAPYDISEDCPVMPTPIAGRGGLWGYAEKIKGPKC